MLEDQPNFHALNVTGLNRDAWEILAFRHLTSITRMLVAGDVKEKGKEYAIPPLKWGDVSRNRDLSILSRLYRFQEQEKDGDVNIANFFGFLSGIGKEIRSKKQYPLIESLHRTIQKLKPTLDPIPHDLMRLSLFGLYLMVCDPNRFLVGLKDGVHWKNANIAAFPDGSSPTSMNLATHYVPMLSRIGKRELVTVPTSIIHPTNMYMRNVQLPEVGPPVDDFLENAYLHQRYLVPPEGAEVRYKRAGDLSRMFVVKSGDNLIARVVTSWGDEQVIINLENASFIIPDRSLLQDGDQSAWATIVAETYHDLVTCEEVPTGKSRGPRGSSVTLDGDNDWNLEEPQVIYIPRQAVKKTAEDFRPKYDGPPRPIKPHLVTNHFRATNMTLQHRNAILELEREWGLSEGEIANNVPAGMTWVRPHFSPKGSEVIMQTSPIFIKRRILADSGIKLRPSLPRSIDDFKD